MKDRYNKILELLTKEKKIEVNELSQILGVSNVTIRKDLDALEEKGIIKGFISVIDKEFIGALFVDNNYQGLGIGSKLIRYVDSIYDELTLTVYKENSRAVSFYKSIGFNILDEQINDDTGSIEYYMKK